ncbi:MAG: methylmalonyl-CoA epimerase, partial [Gemmatimonadetes bacterium]|nr:methylmalonyl-CoA epimerase [Gemmatimonadota bacterium]
MHSVKLDHVAIAVPNLDAAIPLYTALLDRSPVSREHVASEGVEIAFFDAGGTRIELLEPTGPDTPVGRFLGRRGPGLHHITLEVPDLAEALARCRAQGMQPLAPAPRTGAGGRRIAFLDPATTGGLLIELVERAQP